MNTLSLLDASKCIGLMLVITVVVWVATAFFRWDIKRRLRKLNLTPDELRWLDEFDRMGHEERIFVIRQLNESHRRDRKGEL